MPPVLLIHGFASSAEHNWRRPGWLDLLADAGRETIAVDLLGHGTAPKPTDPAEYQEVEARVAAAIDQHDVLDAIGFSAGAHVLLRLAAAQPARFRRLALLGVGSGALDRTDPGPIVAALTGEPDPENVRGMVFRRLADSPGNDRAALIAFLRRPQAPLTAADMAAITCPVLVVLGDQDPAGPGDGLVAALPDARLVTLRGVDHFATPSDFGGMQAVMDFLGVLPVGRQLRGGQLDVPPVAEQDRQRLGGQPGVQVLHTEREQRPGPLQGLRHRRALPQVQPPKRAGERGDLRGQVLGNSRDPRPHDLPLPLGRRVVQVEVQAPAPQRLGQVP